jgi:hypothetical protein
MTIAEAASPPRIGVGATEISFVERIVPKFPFAKTGFRHNCSNFIILETPVTEMYEDLVENFRCCCNIQHLTIDTRRRFIIRLNVNELLCDELECKLQSAKTVPLELTNGGSWSAE